MMMPAVSRKILREYLGMVGGAILFGVACSGFLFPFRVAPGGIGGLSQVLYHFTGWSESFWMFAVNIPLFVLGLAVMGRQFGLRTLLGMLLASAMCWVFEPRHLLGLAPALDAMIHDVSGSSELPRFAFLLTGQLQTDRLLATLAGSSILGLGLGLMFRFRGSTGGTDIPVAILRRFAGIPLAWGYWIVESAIILAVCVAFEDPALMLWAYLGLFLCSKVTDFAAEGAPSIKGVFIMSSRPEELRRAIFERLQRGLTFLKAEGGYHRDARDLIFVCVHRRQLEPLQTLVRSIDPNAFVVIHDTHDVLGEGFQRRTLSYEAPPEVARVPAH